MLSIAVAVMLAAFWIAFFGVFVGLFLMRLWVVVRSDLTMKKRLFVLFTPCSIGYFLTFSDESSFKKVYEILSFFFFFMILIGSIMIYYVHFE